MPVVLLLAAVVRLYRLSFQPLWWDEGWSVYFAHLPIGQMLAKTALDIHPPFYYALLHGWAGLFGFAPSALRSLSVVAGIGTLLIVWLLGRRIIGSVAGILAAFLFAIAPVQVFYSQEVRMYGITTLLAATSWYALLQARSAGDHKSHWWTGYMCVTILALYTEYYSALLILGQSTYILLEEAQKKARLYRSLASLARALSPVALSVILYLPWLIYAFPKLIAYVSAKQGLEGYTPLAPWSFVWSYLSAFTAGHRVDTAQPLLLILIASLVTLSACALAIKKNARRRSLLLVSTCYLAIPLLAGYAVNLLYPFTPRFFERVLLPYSPPIYLLAAAGISSIDKRVERFSLILGATVLSLANLYYFWAIPRYPERDYRPLFRDVEVSGSEEDVILCVHPWQYGYALAYLPPRLRNLYLVPVEKWENDRERNQALTGLLSEARIVWFPAHQSLGRILEERIAADLHRLGYQARSAWFGDETLLLGYTIPSSELVPGQTGAFDYGPCLLSSSFTPVTESGTGAVVALLGWNKTDETLDASLRLVDERGEVWASRDFPLADVESKQTLLVPWGTPATSLTLTLVLSRDGTELHPHDFPPTRFALPLGSVKIEPAIETIPSIAAVGFNQTSTQFQSGPELLGTKPLPPAINQGDFLEVELLWQASKCLDREYILFIQAISAQGDVVAAAEERVTGGVWPMPEWPEEMLVRDLHRLLIPASAPEGQLRIIAGLFDPETRERLAANGSSEVTLGTIAVLAVERKMSPPGFSEPLAVHFGDVATLVGYDLEQTKAAKETKVRLRLVWRAEGETSVRYRSFVHLICNEIDIAQSAQQPGDLPTTAWITGQYVEDVHELTIRSQSAECAEQIQAAVGLYNPANEMRLLPEGAAREKDGRAIIATLSRP